MSDVLVFDTVVNPTGTVVDLPSDVLVFDAPAAPLHVDELANGDFLLFDAPDPAVTVVEAPPDFFLIDAPAAPNYLVSDTGEDVVVITSGGPRGLKGLKGDPGIQGDPGPRGFPGFGGDGGGYFTFHQDQSSDTWDIVHDLPFNPNIVIVDSTGEIVYGDMQVLSATHIRATFSAQFSGLAYLS